MREITSSSGIQKANPHEATQGVESNQHYWGNCAIFLIDQLQCHRGNITANETFANSDKTVSKFNEAWQKK